MLDFLYLFTFLYVHTLSLGRNVAFENELTLSPSFASIQYSSTGAVDGSTDNRDIHKCSGLYSKYRKTKWMQVDLLQQVDINFILLTIYNTGTVFIF